MYHLEITTATTTAMLFYYYKTNSRLQNDVGSEYMAQPILISNSDNAAVEALKQVSRLGSIGNTYQLTAPSSRTFQNRGIR